MPGALVVRSRWPSGLLALLLLLTGLAAWLGVDSAPGGTSARLAQVLAATEDAGSARLVETASQVSLGSPSPDGAGSALVFNVFSTGSVDFSADEFALRSRVVQPGEPPSRSLTYVAPGVLFERFSFPTPGPLAQWTEQPIVYDPVLSIPALAELQNQPPSVRLRRLGPGTVQGVPTTRFEIGPSSAVCTIPNGPGERLDATTIVWVDADGLLRRISLDETVRINTPPPATATTPRHFQTRTTITFSDFGSGMVFQRPSHARQTPGSNGSAPSASGLGPSCRRVGVHEG